MKISFANRVYAAVVIIVNVFAVYKIDKITQNEPESFLKALFACFLACIIFFTICLVIYIIIENFDRITKWLNNLDK